MNKKYYGRRKQGERPFENAEKRPPKCSYRKDKEKDMKLYFYAHNILAYFSNEKWCDLFIGISLSLQHGKVKAYGRMWRSRAQSKRALLSGK